MSIIIAETSWTGANTARNPKTLPPGIGVSASELDNSRGDFRGRPDVTTVHTLVGYGATQQQSLYRMGRETASDTQYWLAFVNDVDFARSLLANDPLERTYGTGGSFVKPSYTDNTFLGSTPYPTGGYYLGIPVPGSGMSASITGTPGKGSNESRTYVSTFTRYNGDESGPSPATSITVPGGTSVLLNTFPAGPDSLVGVTGRNFYVSTGSDFRLFASTALAATSVTDNTLTRGAILQTGGSSAKPAWLPPPDTMIGLIELWSGMHGGFDGKQYLACHPFQPHAWPVQYRRQVPDRIVGSAKWGQNWLLATTGTPRVVMGTTPLALVDAPINFREACVSKRSVVGVGHGVCWASKRGLCYHGQKGTYVMTDATNNRVFTRAQWRALAPETIIGAAWGDWYIGFYNDGSRKGFMINTQDPTNYILLTQGCYAVFSDPLSDTLYLLDSGNTIKKWDSGAVMSATYKSRVYRHPGGSCPGAAQIIATTYPVTFSMWADGVLKVNAQVVTNDDPFRLPDGYWADEFQYQISGVGPVEGVYIAEEIADLP